MHPDIKESYLQNRHKIVFGTEINITGSRVGDGYEQIPLKSHQELWSSEEIMDKLSAFSKVPVLRFQSLYNSFSHFSNFQEQMKFKEKIIRGFTSCKYDKWQIIPCQKFDRKSDNKVVDKIFNEI